MKYFLTVRRVEDVKVDLVLSGLADTVTGPTEVEPTGGPGDGVKGEDGALVGETVLHTPKLPGPLSAPLH